MRSDLFVDLNPEDETGLPWSYLDQATDPSVVVPRRVIVVGSGSTVAVAQVIDVGIDGLVHVRPTTEGAPPLGWPSSAGCFSLAEHHKTHLAERPGEISCRIARYWTRLHKVCRSDILYV